MFCLTIGCLKVEILGTFQKSLTKNWLLVPQNQSKNFSKNSKKWWKTLVFIFVFIMFYWVYHVPQTWYNGRKPILTPSIHSEDTSNHVLKMMWKSVKIMKKSKNLEKQFRWKRVSNVSISWWKQKIFDLRNFLNLKRWTDEQIFFMYSITSF